LAVITSYSTLITTIQDYMARSDLSTFAPNAVQLWEERFYRQPRNYGKWLEASFSIAFTTTATVPTDYLSARVFYLNGQVQQPLKVSSLEQVYLSYPRGGGSGTPKLIARDGAAFVFGPAPSGSFTLNGTYYAKPAPLRSYSTGGADAVAHFLILNAPDLLLYGALLEMEAFTKNDARIAVWSAAHQQAMADYRDLMKAQNFSGGAMQTLVA
jgi:hypothetical protein